MEHTELMEQPSALPEKGERLNVVAAEIRMLKGQAKQMALGYAVEIGRRLTEAKAMVPHGEWGEWLKREVDYSQSTAQNLMKVYRELDDQTSLFGPSKAQALGNLSFTNVLRILTIPEGPERDEFLLEHDVASMSTRELDAAIKERDAALKAAEEARAEQSAAEHAREEIAEDMKLANERIAGLNAEAEAQAAKVKEAQDAAAQLEKELAELRSRPVDVAVETDTAAIEAARREAEEKMRAKLDKAKKAQDKAEKDRQTAEEAKAAAQEELSRVRAEAQALREQTERAEKKAALTANEDVVLFRTLFDQAQEAVNRMTGVLMKMRGKNPETAEGLSRAMLALCEKIKEGTSFGGAEQPSRQPSAAQEVAQG